MVESVEGRSDGSGRRMVGWGPGDGEIVGGEGKGLTEWIRSDGGYCRMIVGWGRGDF